MKQTVTIGIAAHNEGKNIYSLLSDLLKQSQTSWTLSQIVIYCDGCVDNTISEIKRIRNKKIIIIEGKKQKGKCFGLNKIIKDATGENIVFLDADITLGSNNVVTNLIKYVGKYTVIGGNVRPIKPISFFQRAVYSTFLVFDESRKKIKQGNNIFGCNGGCVLVNTAFAKSIHIPNIINDDDFIYFSCIQRGLLFKHVRNAIVYYKLPTKLSDYLKQLFRSNPTAVDLNVNKYFGELVEKEYSRPVTFYIAAIAHSFITLPIETTTIVAINFLCKPLYRIITTNYKLSWHTAVTTK